MRGTEVRIHLPQAASPLRTDFSRGGSQTAEEDQLARQAIELPRVRNRARRIPQYGDYSITSSARANSIGGTLMPRDSAVFRLMTRDNRVGCCTGKLAGFAP